MKSFDIFISYRHAYTADKAEHLLTLLENNGYRSRVSFDRDNLNSRFDIEILRRIDNCKDFIIVLSEGTFENISFACFHSTSFIRCYIPAVNRFKQLIFTAFLVETDKITLTRTGKLNSQMVFQEYLRHSA